MCRFFPLLVCMGWAIGIQAQCPISVPDTARCCAPHLYQNDFKFTFKGEPINGFSDMHGKVKHGQWYIFSKSGLVTSSGCYQFDLKQGWWKYYSLKGHLRELIYYKHGQELCIIDPATGKRREHPYKEKPIGPSGWKLADSLFW